MHPLERPFHQVYVVLAITAFLVLGHPHQRMEVRLVTDVLKVITVPEGPQHHWHVPLDITATQQEMVISLIACLVLQVGTYFYVAHVDIILTESC